MKKLVFLFLSTTIMVVLISCNSQTAEVKRLITQFAEAVNNNDSTAICSMYPLAGACDSILFSIQGADINVEKGDTVGVFIAKVNDKELSVKVDEDGTMAIVDSRNVLSYGKKKKEFALASGWIEDGMSDAQMAERFADNGFIEYLGSSLIKELNNNVRVQDWEYSMNPMEMSARMIEGSLKTTPLQFVVVNNTPYDIEAEDYVIEAEISYLRVAGVDNQKKEVKGETLGANSTIKVKYNLQPVYDDPNLFEDVVSSKIVLNISEEEALQKYFIPKGGEYKTYLYTKGKK